MIQRSDDVSYRARTSGGSAQIRTSIVGTIIEHVMRSRWMRPSAPSGSKWFISTTVPPSESMICTNAGAAL
jgi:hypothetical protein